MSTLIDSIYNVDFREVGCMSLLQFAFGIVWFHIIVHHFETYYLAADKGVRRVEHVVHRYPSCAVHLMAFLSCLLRSVVVLVLLDVSSSKSLLEYQYAALVGSGIALVTAHRHFMCQRPMQLFVTEWGFEFTASMIAAIACFYMRLHHL